MSEIQMMNKNENIDGDNKSVRLRVRFSAVINFSSFLYRLVISIGFSTLVIRRLTIDEYGLFTTLFAIYGLFTPVILLWTLWSFRYYVRRGVNIIVKTGHTLSYIYSIFAGIVSILFIASIPYANILYRYNIFATVIIIFITQIIIILQNTYITFASGYAPYIIGYSSMIMDTIRFLLAFILVYYLSMGFIGALLSVFIAHVLTYLYLFYFLHRKTPWPGFGIYRSALKLFFKNSFIPLTNIVRSQIESSGEKILSGLISASPVYPAYLGIAGISNRLIRGSGGTIYRSLSPSLLRRPSREDIEDIIKLSVIIVFFITGVSIIYAKTIISVLNPIYLDGIALFIAYSLVSLLSIFTGLFNTIGVSSDRSDLYTSGLGLRKSIIFKNNLTYLIASTLRFIIDVILFSLFYFVFGIKSINILLTFPIIAIIIYTMQMLVFYKRSKNLVEYTIPLREVIASIIGVFAVYAVASFTGLNNIIVYRISRDYLYIILIVLQSITTYLVVLLILSPWFRKFIHRGYVYLLASGFSSK